VRRHAATAVVLALLVGAAVAFAETERLKLKPTPIEESFVQPTFSPACSCPQATAAIRLRLHRADTVTVRIRDFSGEVVRVLVEDRRLPRGRTELEWDGRDAPDGRYRVEVELADADRTFRLPQLTTLDTVSPTAHVVSYRPEVLQPRQKVRVFYRVSEPAHGVLFVNGRRRVLTHTKLRAAKLDWRPQQKGRYRLQLAAVDLAGNLGRLSPVFVVRVR
jgi:hypothetical protein